MKLSRYIDSSPLNPAMTSDEVRAAITEAVRQECCSVCVQPADIPLAVQLCRNTDTRVCTVLDFPHGKAPAAVKEIEARYYMEYGAEELDMVMNYGLARSGKWDEVEVEIRAVANAAHARNVLVKVIFEASQLTSEEIARATEVSIAAGADFVKTATDSSALEQRRSSCASCWIRRTGDAMSRHPAAFGTILQQRNFWIWVCIVWASAVRLSQKFWLKQNKHEIR